MNKSPTPHSGPSPVPSNISSNSSNPTAPPASSPPFNFKSITPSPLLAGIAKLSDEELRRKGIEDLVALIRRIESDCRSLVVDHSNSLKEVNRRLQMHLAEIRGLKEVNQKLQEDNQELRDLCCFLDDDRQRGRKLAREWQRFGRYTASVMRSEVTTYQDKLQELELKQNDLISNNLELKELCLYLDQERDRFSQDRDDGDGSSNTTTASEQRDDSGLHTTSDGVMHRTGEPQGSNPDMEQALVRQRNTVNESTLSYLRQLEEKVKRLEQDKASLAQRVEHNGGEGYPSDRQHLLPTDRVPNIDVKGSSKTESVVHAMKVLEVHEQLERPHTDVGEENLDDKEKAIVREMCNVVWRKLGDAAPDRVPTRDQYMPPPPPAPHPAPGLTNGTGGEYADQYGLSVIPRSHIPNRTNQSGGRPSSAYLAGHGKDRTLSESSQASSVFYKSNDNQHPSAGFPSRRTGPMTHSSAENIAPHSQSFDQSRERHLDDYQNMSQEYRPGSKTPTDHYAGMNTSHVGYRGQSEPRNASVHQTLNSSYYSAHPPQGQTSNPRLSMQQQRMPRPMSPPSRHMPPSAHYHQQQQPPPPPPHQSQRPAGGDNVYYQSAPGPRPQSHQPRSQMPSGPPLPPHGSQGHNRPTMNNYIDGRNSCPPQPQGPAPPPPPHGPRPTQPQPYTDRRHISQGGFNDSRSHPPP